ncbi:meteorin [Camelus ferus]|uniref:Meteorin n=1 Tax=Camelus ferus TaxID=419612 RepID=A0A8B8RF47_CAMFR|nr:meteorin [Camelus ferus]
MSSRGAPSRVLPGLQAGPPAPESAAVIGGKFGGRCAIGRLACPPLPGSSQAPRGVRGRPAQAVGPVRGRAPRPSCSPPRPRASSRAMPPPALLCALCCGLLAVAARAGYSEDRCSWRGSGLTQEPGSVGQLALACAEGGIEWLYPAGALRLTLGGSDPGGRPSIACLRPARPFAGAQVFAEREGGTLELLLAEGRGPARGRCVRWGPREHRALFLQATPHPDISRRVASFRFELREDGRPELPPQAQGLGADGACRPCSDAEFLLAACTSDFVILGTIHGVTHDTELQESIITVAAVRVLRQTLPLFRIGGPGAQVQASIRTPLRCGVRPGPGIFLFMGWSHFGEAWLGCAPRFREFSRVYAAAHTNHLHPCEVVLD